jgi:hypothetical protein
MPKLEIEGTIQIGFGTEVWVLFCVENEEGEPVTGLTEKDIEEHAFASLNHVGWHDMKPTIFDEEGPGFYSLQSQLVNPDQPWSISSDWVVALHVRADAGMGQALITCHDNCAGADGGTDRRSEG